MFVSTNARAGVSLHDFCWHAGIREGEGSFCCGPPSAPRSPVLKVEMTDEDVMRRVGALLGRKPVGVRSRKPGWSPTWQIRLTGSRAVAWMRLLRPVLGERRQGQVDRAVASYDPGSNRLLDDARAADALERLASGATVRAVATEFGTSIWCIYDLRLGRTHKHLDRSGLAS